jgi:hypothetical protein
MSISAMKQALEALDAYSWEQVDAARAALRQAIAEAEKQESVAFVSKCNDGECLISLINPAAVFYAAPVHASDISQEPVDETAKDRHEFECPRCGHCCQQKEWTGLTDDDYEKLLETKDWGGSLIKAVEAKLKEKNS